MCLPVLIYNARSAGGAQRKTSRVLWTTTISSSARSLRALQLEIDMAIARLEQSDRACNHRLRGHGLSTQWCFTALILSTFVGTFGTPLNAQRSELQLVQHAFLHVPADVQVSGARLSQDGSIVFWSRESGGVWRAEKGSMQRLCAATDLVPIAAGQVNSALVEIFDAQTNEIVSAGNDGECGVRLRLGRQGAVQAASYTPATDEWLAVEADSDGSAVLLAERTNVIRRFPLDASLFRESKATHVRFTHDGLVLTSLRWPFNWRLIRLDGRILATGQPFASDVVMALGEDTSSVSQWRGLPAYQIDSAFLQVLADPRSDVRALAVYDVDGSTRSLTLVGLSLGILDFEPLSNRLLMLRRTNGQELVTYRLQLTSP